jgi:hypothetical protein
MAVDSSEARRLKESIDDLKTSLFGEDGQGGEFASIQQRLERQNIRIAHLENLRWWLLGAIAALAGSQIIGDIISRLALLKH